MRIALLSFSIVGMMALLGYSANKYLSQNDVPAWTTMWGGFVIVFGLIGVLFVYMIVKGPTGE